MFVVIKCVEITSNLHTWQNRCLDIFTIKPIEQFWCFYIRQDILVQVADVRVLSEIWWWYPRVQWIY